MANHYLPTEKTIRNRIEDIEEESYRFGFMYQLLIAGRITEMCGEYAPRGDDAFEVEFEVGGDSVPAILFAVKTAKRKGKLRACAVPLEPAYEPWAEPLLKYFKEANENYPFMFGPTFKTSTIYAQRIAKRTFEGLEWPMISYTNHKTGEKVPDRWKHVTSHVLRKRRTLTLRLYYGFDGFNLSAYGGWTEKSQVDTLPGALKHYLYIDIQEAKEAIGLLKDMANIYFPKLLKPAI